MYHRGPWSHHGAKVAAACCAGQVEKHAAKPLGTSREFLADVACGGARLQFSLIDAGAINSQLARTRCLYNAEAHVVCVTVTVPELKVLVVVTVPTVATASAVVVVVVEMTSVSVVVTAVVVVVVVLLSPAVSVMVVLPLSVVEAVTVTVVGGC